MSMSSANHRSGTLEHGRFAIDAGEDDCCIQPCAVREMRLADVKNLSDFAGYLPIGAEKFSVEADYDGEAHRDWFAASGMEMAHA
jgi:hypothetical protein